MFGKRKLYTCPKCHKPIMVKEEAKLVRCPNCQTNVETADSSRHKNNGKTNGPLTTSIKTQGMAKYTCQICGHSYLFDSFAHPPACPRCKSSAATPRTPAARVVAKGFVGTKKQRKQQKYEARSIRMMTQLQEHKGIVSALLAMMEIPDVLRDDLLGAFDRVIAGAEKEQQAKLRRYKEVNK